MKTAEKPVEHAPAFELKGSALTLMVLHLLDADAGQVLRQLPEKLGQAPGVFRNAPLIIDPGVRPESAPPLDLAALVQGLRALGLAPVALRGGSDAQKAMALAAGLGLLPALRLEPVPKAAAEPPAQPPDSPPHHAAAAKVVSQPVRSGQRVVAEGDLIVLASVNSGAEILAGGNIHVYGTLRGRALAGVRGDTASRICCLQFSPELVAIAGEYLLNDELDPAHVGKSVVVALDDDRVHIEPLGSFVPFG